MAALMIVGSLNPLVSWLERRNVRRAFAIFLVFATVAALAGTLLTLTVPTVISQVKSVIGNESKIRESIAVYLEPPPSRRRSPTASGMSATRNC